MGGKRKSFKEFRAAGGRLLLRRWNPPRPSAARKAASQLRVASEADHPQKLRAFLLGLFYSGEISAVLIVKLSLLITRAGGKGLEDLGREIKHSKKRVEA